MNYDYNLTLILPVYNPEHGWENGIINSLNMFRKEFSDIKYRVVIVNDGSTSNIEHFVENNLLPVYKHLIYYSYSENQGKGFAIRYGLRHSLSDYYIYTDFDFPYGCSALKGIYCKLAEGHANLVLGTRDNDYYKSTPFKRKLISRGTMILNGFATRFRVKDTQAGLKGFDNKAREILLTTKTNSYVFDFEFILKCLRNDLKVKTISVKPNPDILFSNFKAKILLSEFMNYLRIIFGRK